MARIITRRCDRCGLAEDITYSDHEGRTMTLRYDVTNVYVDGGSWKETVNQSYDLCKSCGILVFQLVNPQSYKTEQERQQQLQEQEQEHTKNKETSIS
jgi:hypothetical protein